MGRLQLTFCLMCALALVAFTAGCANTGVGDAADAESPQEPDTTVLDADGDASQESPPLATELDLDTLQADTPEGILRAERAGDSYVCPINDGRAIGIAFLGDLTAAEEHNDQQQVVAYLYDRQELAVMTGELDSEGAATLQSGELSDFEATVELTMDEEAVSGTATFPGEEPAPFTVETATGIAGVYWAEGTEEEPEVSGDWVVLPDERQWGCVCLPPFTSPCCLLRTL